MNEKQSKFEKMHKDYKMSKEKLEKCEEIL